MTVFFEDKDLEELISTGKNTKYKKYARDKRFMEALVRDYGVLCAVEQVSILNQYSFLHYEQLKGCNLSSIRVQNGRIERLLFRESENGIVITLIDLDNTHYGNK